jgi:4-amino-4-deoxy-L-arabinose transferase-like glycosyltransferase
MGRQLRQILARHRYALGVGALVVLTAPLGIRSRPLWVGDETREAAIAKQMADSGDFLQTRLAGRAVGEKPPFYYASVASSIRLGHGATRFSTRLPSILFSALTLLAAATSATILFSPRAGLFSAVVLATTYLFAANGHNVVVDVALTAFVSLGLLAFFAASRRSGFPRWDLAFGLAAGGAMLAKGMIGPTLLLLLTVPFWLLSRPRRSLRECVSPGAVLAPAAALLVWTGVTFARGGVPALSEAMWNQQVGRLLGLRRREYSHHRAPFYFYLASLPGMLFPWIVSLPSAAARGLRERLRPGGPVGKEGSAPGSLPFLPMVAGLAAAFVFLSAAATKRTIYFLPLVPAAAILIGGFLDARLAESRERIPRGLWVQFFAVALGAVAALLLPAMTDRRVTAGEGAGIVAVAACCAALAVNGRRSPGRLVAVSFLLALGALVLLDRYSLPRWKRDRATKNFFARVERRLSPTDRLYSFELNEDVLGWACLELARAPVAEGDPGCLFRKLAEPGAFLLADIAGLANSGAEWAGSLEVVLRGRAGSRPVGLFRLRRPDLRAPPLPDEAKSFAHTVRKEEPADRHGQENRRHDRGDLRSRRLANPEGAARNDPSSNENALDQEVQDQGGGQAEQDPFPLAREAYGVFDAASEDKAHGSPNEAIDERGSEITEEEGDELHSRCACGEEDDRAQPVQVASQEDEAVTVPLKLFPDLLHPLWREDLLQEPVALQGRAEEAPESEENQVRNQDAAKLRPDHQRESGHAPKYEKPRD